MVNDIKALDPAAFLEIGKKRAKAVMAASSETPVFEHSANRLARELHPSKQFLIVKDIIKRSKNCYTYVLAPNVKKGTEKLAYFSAGQYISVKDEIDGYVHDRPYSLVSSPKDALDGTYEIMVKNAVGGLVSVDIIKNWKIGTEVEVSEPMGNFTYESLRDAPHIVGAAGGSGITPFISLAKAIADGDEDCSLTLICGIKTLADRLFYDELTAFSKKCDKIHMVYVFSDEEVVGCEHGEVTADIIRKYAPAERYSLFICGSLQFHLHMEKETPKLGIEQKYIRHDLYGEPSSLNESGKIINITVRINGEEKIITGTTSDTILRSLEKNKIDSPSRCRSGECGFCRAKLIKGDVIIPKESDRRRLADDPHGYIHPCCTYPKDDIIIEIGTDK